MGRGGTEVAREVADLVLTDDDFATIVAAIREGRAIADNIRKFVAFLLSANLGEVALFAVAIPAGLGVPMTVVQVLLVNVLTDGLPAIALTRDPAAPDTMRRSPERGDRLFPSRAWGALAALGILVGLAALAAFLVGRSVGDNEARTMAFATVALAELALVFSVRSPSSCLGGTSQPLFDRERRPLRRRRACRRVRAGLERAARHRAPWRRRARSCRRSVVPFLCVEVGKALSRSLGWTLEGARA